MEVKNNSQKVILLLFPLIINKFNFQQFFEEQAYKVVANIPYYITGKILKMLLSAKTRPTSITLLTQKEVAENIIAEPGQLSEKRQVCTWPGIQHATL